MPDAGGQRDEVARRTTTVPVVCGEGSQGFHATDQESIGLVSLHASELATLHSEHQKRCVVHELRRATTLARACAFGLHVTHSSSP
jgi:hypothetical protein